MQPTHAGWYWDPNGRPGLFRWWDGVNWTRHISVDRNDFPPEPFLAVRPGEDGMLRAGALAFPALDEPWRQCPAYTGFGAAIAQERAVGRTPRGEYDAIVVIGSAPDRFSGSSDVVLATSICTDVLDTFYPSAKPSADPAASTVEIDGHTAARLDVELDVAESTLDFDGESLLIVVIGSDVLYASLPHVDGVPSAEEVVSLLRSVSPANRGSGSGSRTGA